MFQTFCEKPVLVAKLASQVWGFRRTHNLMYISTPAMIIAFFSQWCDRSVAHAIAPPAMDTKTQMFILEDRGGQSICMLDWCFNTISKITHTHTLMPPLFQQPPEDYLNTWLMEEGRLDHVRKESWNKGKHGETLYVLELDDFGLSQQLQQRCLWIPTLWRYFMYVHHQN